ncbi:hypothetical protein [uncultured Shewanella sp.]|uniref:hypothetical protein n=1 Tax=uncultured Shewanella sp. TaxID=173975 RepID=UPI002633D647|nr:hypothetical protein [uncultured Shewanella sp.]
MSDINTNYTNPIDTTSASIISSSSSNTDDLTSLSQLLLEFQELTRKATSTLQELQPQQLQNQYDIRVAALHKQLDAIDTELQAGNTEAVIGMIGGVITTLSAFAPVGFGEVGSTAIQTAAKGLTEGLTSASKTLDLTYIMGKDKNGMSLNELSQLASTLRAESEFVTQGGQAYDQMANSTSSKISQLRQELTQTSQQLVQLIAGLEKAVQN